MTSHRTGFVFPLLLAFLLFAPHGGTAGEASTSPLSVIQMNPVMMRYLDIQPRSALPSGDIHHFGLRQRFASIFLADTLPVPTRFLADMEILATELQMRTRLGNADVQAIVPLLRPTAGVLDNFVRNFHRGLSLPSGGRELRPNSQYTYLLKGGWNSAASWKMGNITLDMQYPLVQESSQGLAILSSVKLPTANRTDGWGSGSWDASLGLIVSRRWESAFMHMEAHVIHPFGEDYVHSLKNRNYFRGALTLGWKSNWAEPLVERPLSAILQLQGGTSPYSTTGIIALDETPVLVAMGVRWKSDAGNDWQLVFTENITLRSTQDFSLTLGCDFF